MTQEILKLAEQHPQLKKLIEDVAVMAEYIQVDLEHNNIADFAALETYQEFADNYKNILWVCTDPNNEQYGRKLAEGHYEFKEKNRFHDINDEGEIIQMDILLSMYDDKKIQSHVSAYCDSLESLKEIYGENWEWVLAEIIFEQESGLY